MQQKKRKSGLAIAGRQLFYVLSPLILLAIAAFFIEALRGIGIIG